MMNFVALCLVVSSLAAAGVWSPTPNDQKQNQDNQNEDVVIVKEGHRVIVVEYDEQGMYNTKVSISPEHEYKIPKTASKVDGKISSAAADALNNAKDEIKEASSVLPNLGQGISGSKFDEVSHVHGPGQLICDAYGKCRHKIASAIEKAKDKVSGAAHEEVSKMKEMSYEAKDMVSEAAHQVIDKKKEMAHEAKDVVQDAFGKVKDTASEKAYEAKEAANDELGKAKETASEKASGAKESGKDALSKAKETASQKAHEAKEGAKETVVKAKENSKDAKDVGKTIGEDIALNLSEQVENVRESTVEKTKEVKEGTEYAAERVKTGVHNLFDRFGKFLRHMGLPETLNALMAVLNLLGFATAYGMSVWVTFVSSYVLATALPRQQFGMVQSKIYPVYFRAMACSIGFALLGHMPHLFSSKAGMIHGDNLLASFLMVLANSMYLEPRATKVIFEWMKVEKEEGRGRESLTAEASRRSTEQRTATEPATLATTTTAAAEGEHPEQEVVRTKMARLSERLKKLNTWSSVVNIMTLMSLTWHLVYLSQRLGSMQCRY